MHDNSQSLTDPITNNQLKKVSWIPIKRHVLIKYDYSPFNIDLKDIILKNVMLKSLIETM